MRFRPLPMTACAALISALIAALLPTVAAAQAPAPTRLARADEAAAVAWLKRTAQPLSSDRPDAAELAPLLARLAGARVIGLGEATHGTHEEQAFKAALVQALVAAGRINAVAFIASFHAGQRLDAYAAGGPGTAADALRESGLPAVWATEEVAGLLDALRRWNLAGKERVRVVGLDVQDVLRDTRTALALLASVEPEAARPLQDVWKEALAGERAQRPFAEVVREWTREQWETMFVAARVLEDLFARPTTRLSQAPGYADARQAARAARLGLLVFEVGASGTSSSGSADADLARDLAIGEQLLAMVGPPARAVVWGHDAQLARGPTARSAAATTGELLLDRLGPSYRTVGFAWRRGAFHALALDGAGRVDSAAGFRVWPARENPASLGALVGRTGQRRAWFDLRALPEAGWSQRFLAHPFERGWAGVAVGGEPAPPVPLGTGFDVLVFFDTITPSRLLPR